MTFRLMQSVLTNVRRNNLTEPIKRVALERSRIQAPDQPLFSIYRDILFLAFTALGRGNIDQGMLHAVKTKLLYVVLKPRLMSLCLVLRNSLKCLVSRLMFQVFSTESIIYH